MRGIQTGFDWAPPRVVRAASGVKVDLSHPTFKFYLGTHKWRWLFDEKFRNVPMFISYRQIREAMKSRKELQAAVTRWCLDSGGFMELSTEGKWTYTAREYAKAVQRFAREIGGIEWAAIMDWMTEECVLERTGLNVREHQRRTADSLLELRSIAPEIPWAPVLQGWGSGDHMRHIEDYERRGIDLWREPIVGVGSVCRRSTTDFATMLLGELADLGLLLHAFGFKIDGLTGPSLVGPAHGPLASSAPLASEHHPDTHAPQPDGTWLPVWMRVRSGDSLAWSFHARKVDPLPTCTHECCNNCPMFALAWRGHLLDSLQEAAGEILPYNGPPPYPWPVPVLG